MPLPKALLDFMGYCFFFWPNENNEPAHIHVCKERPSQNATKFLVKEAGVILEHNNSNIPQSDLRKIQEYISLNKKDIIYEWFRHFNQ